MAWRKPLDRASSRLLQHERECNGQVCVHVRACFRAVGSSSQRDDCPESFRALPAARPHIRKGEDCMSSKVYRTLCLAVGVTTAVAFAGCTNYVKRSDFDAAITKLQNTDQSLQQQINSLQQDMQSHFAKYDTQITAMQGRIRVDTVAHFAFNEATLQDDDKAMLDEFAKVMRTHHSD